LQLSGLEITVPKFEAAEVPVLPNAGEKKAQKKKKKAKKAALAEGEMEEAKDLKREKKDKKEKKEKKKKRKVEVVDQGNATEKSTMGDGIDGITFDETLKSYLQKQFEMAAAEAGMPKGGSSSGASPVTPASGKVATKRKRSKSADKLYEASYGDDGSEGNLLARDGEKSGKRVRFSMKNNLVWKPHNPLPPQCLRLPPSAPPRGSALKKGVWPGPIAPTPLKKAKPKAKSAKVLKKQPSFAVKCLRKLQCFSA